MKYPTNLNETSKPKGKAFRTAKAIAITIGLILLVTGSVVLGQAVYNAVVNTEGTKVQTPNGLTTGVTSISWGSLEPGASVTSDLVITNNTPSPLEVSYMLTNQVNFDAVESCDWNLGSSYVLAGGGSVTAEFTLEVTNNLSNMGLFSFDIDLTADSTIS